MYFRGKIGGKEDTWHLREAGASMKLCSGAVQQSVLCTCRCSLWNPKTLSPPIASDEILVSSVIELSCDGPPDLEHRESVKRISFTVALLHSAPYLEGYVKTQVAFLICISSLYKFVQFVSSYGARGKFGEHERSLRVARGNSRGQL